MIQLPLFALLQAGYHTAPHAAGYSAATTGMFLLIVVIGIEIGRAHV